MKKIKVDKKYFTICLYAVISLCAVALFFTFLSNFSSIWEFIKNFLQYLFNLIKPVLWGFIIAYLLYRPTKFYSRVLSKVKRVYISEKANRVLSAIMALLSMIIVIFFLVYIAVPGLVESIGVMVANIPDYMESANGLAVKLFESERLIETMQLFGIDITSVNDISQLITSFWGYIQGALEGVATYILNFVVSFSTMIINLFLGIFFALYMLIDKDQIMYQLSSVVKRISSKFFYRAKYVLQLMDEMFFNFLAKKALCSVIVGFLVFIPCRILGIRYAGLISIIVGVTNMVPTFGPIFGAIPAVLLAMLTAPISGLWTLIIIIIVQQIDSNVLAPALLGDSIGVNPFWVIFSIVICGKLWGVMGMLLALPIFGVLRILFKDWLRRPIKEEALEEQRVEEQMLDIKMERFYEEKAIAKKQRKDFKKLQKRLHKIAKINRKKDKDDKDDEP